jgi:DNA modification methylase
MGIERRIGRDNKFKKQKLEKTKARRKALGSARRQSELAGKSLRNDLVPDLRIITVPIADLRPAPRRTRRIDEDHIERLMVAIADLGFSVPILVADGRIVDGHARVEAAKRLRLAELPAIDVSHLSPVDRRKLALAVNRLGELGEWDLSELRIEFAELIDLDVDLTATGFTSQEQDIILLDDAQAGAESDEDEPPDPPQHPVTRLGDVWICNQHRVICANSLEDRTYKALLLSEAAHCVLTDPPYNVLIQNNVSGLGKKVHDEFVMASGELNDEEWQAFLDQLLKLLAMNLAGGSVLFLFMDWRSIHRLYLAGDAAGLRRINLCIWYKEAGAMGALYRSAYELVAVFCKGTKPRVNNVELGKNGRDRQNVWVAPGANRQGSSANEMLHLHATPKPVELCVDAILDVTDPGDIVLDAFLGSGTTLIAAEKTGRRCRGIELEPKFVDVSVIRWMQLTGLEPVLEETGETFEEVCARRSVKDDDDHDTVEGDEQ